MAGVEAARRDAGHQKEVAAAEPGAIERLKGRASDSASVWVAVTAASTLEHQSYGELRAIEGGNGESRHELA
jgi:hypothetical protein